MSIDATNSTSSGPVKRPDLYTGARIQFIEGRIVMTPPQQRPPNWIPALVSIVSPGTELRQLAATRNGSAYMAGYMTVGILPDAGSGHTLGQLLLAPVPHGACFRSDHPRALSLNVDAQDRATLATTAVGRFQLIAALGLRRIVQNSSLDDALIIGSGPVAVGCALEMRRLGAVRIRVLTTCQHPPIAEVPGVTIVAHLESRSAAVVIDCAGRPDVGANVAVAGGILGLLGTPSDDILLSALHIHRASLYVIGMHELLNYDHAQYQQYYAEVIQWLTTTIEADLLQRWCLYIPGADAVHLYESLASEQRPSVPFLLLEW